MADVDIKNYIYLDEQGIDSIYAQLTNTIVLEQRVSETKTNRGLIRAGVSGLIKGIFVAEGEGERTGCKASEKLIAYSYEQKLNKIFDTLSNSDSYCTNLDESMKKCIQNQSLTLVNAWHTFHSRLDFQSHEVFEYIQKCGYIEFEMGDKPISSKFKIKYNVRYDNYTYEDDYYKKSKYRVVMPVGIDKLKTSYNGMTSHLAVALRGSHGKIGLGVFGQIKNINDLYFQIKPFAIWW